MRACSTFLSRSAFFGGGERGETDCLSRVLYIANEHITTQTCIPTCIVLESGKPLRRKSTHGEERVAEHGRHEGEDAEDDQDDAQRAADGSITKGVIKQLVSQSVNPPTHILRNGENAPRRADGTAVVRPPPGRRGARRGGPAVVRIQASARAGLAASVAGVDEDDRPAGVDGRRLGGRGRRRRGSGRWCLRGRGPGGGVGEVGWCKFVRADTCFATPPLHRSDLLH